MPGSCPQNFVRTRTWTATDKCGNVRTASQAITVQDTTKPVISCPGDIILQGDGLCKATVPVFTPTTSDNCGTVTVTQNPPAGTILTGPGVTVVTLTATDACGNSDFCTVRITISCRSALGDLVWLDKNRDGIQDSSETNGVANVTVILRNGATLAPIATNTTTSAGIYGFVDLLPAEYVIEVVPPAGFAFSPANVGTNNLADSDFEPATGRTASFFLPGNVTDLSWDAGLFCLAPVLVCPPNVDLQCPAGTSTNVTGVATATSPCGCAITLGYSDATVPGCGSTLTLTRTWTATDACGNTSTCQQTIRVIDTTRPVLSGVGGPITIECDQPVVFSSPTATDNCDTTPTLTFADATIPGSCPQNFVRTRTWTATDACGNVQTASQAITIQDTTRPVLNGVPGPGTFSCDNIPAPPVVTASDNCDTEVPVTFDSLTLPGSCANSYVIVRTWTAMDDCGNTRAQNQTLTIVDTTAPVISGVGPAATIQCDQPIVFSTPTATDNCDTTPTLTFADATVPGSCPQNFVRTRTWTAIDKCGNVKTASQAITVQDTTKPVITCPNAVTVQCLSDVPAPSPASVVATDNCGPATVTHDGDTATGTPCNRVITRTYRATDACGNFATCTQTITVIDNTRPVQTGFLQDQILQCVSQLPAPVQPVVVDNCDTSLTVSMVTLTDFSPVNCSRSTRYVWTFTDDCGNRLRITQTFFIRDRTKPVITCPAPVTLTGDADCKVVLPALVPTVSDNCGAGGVVVVQSPPAGTVLTGPGTTVVTLTATDACGNAASCTTSVTVNCGTPAIELVKTVYPGHDGGSFCPGAEIVISTNNAPVTYCFEVKNTGALNLINLKLNDATLGMPEINVGSLAVGQSRMFSVDALILASLTNVAQVAGTSVTGVPVSDTDDAEVKKIRPQIQIVKTVAYGDNAPCPGLDFIYAVNGQPVTYCFVVTNLGNVPLTQVEITDDDIGMSPIPLGDLAVGQSKPAQISVIANGSLTNTAWAVGLPPVGLPVKDDDPAEILGLGPSVKWSKTAYIGHDGGARCPGNDVALINGPGTPVTYCFEVKNTGDVTLYNTEVSDPMIGFSSVVGTLNVGQTVMLHAEVFVNAAVTNVARVTVLPPSGGAFFIDDGAVAENLRAAVQIDKTVAAGYGGYASCILDSVKTLNLPAPGAVTYCFKVRNTGNTHLNNLAITDVDLGVREFDMEYVGPSFPLAPGAEAMYMVKAYASASMVNHVQISATPTDENGAPYAGSSGVGDLDQAQVIIQP
ncbi:MAG: SdrD B-like domain-containing protein [Kiritimatiellia bacterium]